MKEYKVMTVKSKKAEEVMNEMARDGWEVVAVTYWGTERFSTVLVTFVKEKQFL